MSAFKTFTNLLSLKISFKLSDKKSSFSITVNDLVFFKISFVKEALPGPISMISRFLSEKYLLFC